MYVVFLSFLHFVILLMLNFLITVRHSGFILLESAPARIEPGDVKRALVAVYFIHPGVHLYFIFSIAPQKPHANT